MRNSDGGGIVVFSWMHACAFVFNGFHYDIKGSLSLLHVDLCLLIWGMLLASVVIGGWQWNSNGLCGATYQYIRIRASFFQLLFLCFGVFDYAEPVNHW